ncbi:BQ2448_1603 [Microbotryum intermedium]|uniref:BQ2448_1603 protein n=1 Tax=Microbotryum intermedium TaxID=269621 RepID=A0A238FBP2_9BASI|nr:BQ2448_1603 [Microbotryum intermedium]
MSEIDCAGQAHAHQVESHTSRRTVWTHLSVDQSLPPEIMEQFATHLHRRFARVYEDQRNAPLVCRSWRDAFQREICTHVDLMTDYPRRVARSFLASGLMSRYNVGHLEVYMAEKGQTFLIEEIVWRARSLKSLTILSDFRYPLSTP